MIKSVSSVNFCAATPNDIISRPGAFTKPSSPAPQAIPEKKGKALKTLAAVVALGIATAGMLVYGAKNGKWFKQLDNLADAKFLDKAKHYLAYAGNKIDEKVLKPALELIQRFKPNKAS